MYDRCDPRSMSSGTLVSLFGMRCTDNFDLLLEDGSMNVANADRTSSFVISSMS